MTDAATPSSTDLIAPLRAVMFRVLRARMGTEIGEELEAGFGRLLKSAGPNALELAYQYLMVNVVEFADRAVRAREAAEQ